MVISLAYIALIFATTPVLPPVVNSLYRLNRIIIPTFVTTVYLAAGLGLFSYFFMRKIYRNNVSMLLFALFLVANILMLKLIHNPVEKIHLAEYELLSILLYRAMLNMPNRKRGLALYHSVWCFSFTVGFFDELYQGLLPNRYFTAADVISNGVAAALGLTLLASGMMTAQLKAGQAGPAQELL